MELVEHWATPFFHSLSPPKPIHLYQDIGMFFIFILLATAASSPTQSWIHPLCRTVFGRYLCNGHSTSKVEESRPHFWPFWGWIIGQTLPKMHILDSERTQLDLKLTNNLGQKTSDFHIKRLLQWYLSKNDQNFHKSCLPTLIIGGQAKLLFDHSIKVMGACQGQFTTPTWEMQLLIQCGLTSAKLETLTMMKNGQDSTKDPRVTWWRLSNTPKSIFTVCHRILEGGQQTMSWKMCSKGFVLYYWQ